MSVGETSASGADPTSDTTISTSSRVSHTFSEVDVSSTVGDSTGGTPTQGGVGDSTSQQDLTSAPVQEHEGCRQVSGETQAGDAGPVAELLPAACELFPAPGFRVLEHVTVGSGVVQAFGWAAGEVWNAGAVGRWGTDGEFLGQTAVDVSPFPDEWAARSPGGRSYATSIRYTDTGVANTVVTALGPAGEQLWERSYEEYGAASYGRMALAGDYVAAIVSYVRPESDPCGCSMQRDDLIVYLHDVDGELIWRKRILANGYQGAGLSTLFGIDVNAGGEVVLAGRYEDLAFVQSRDATGTLNWHRTFAEPWHWEEVAWSGEDGIVLGTTTAQSIAVRQLSAGGADVWARDIEVREYAYLGDLDVDEEGDVYVVGAEGGPFAAMPLLARLNAAQMPGSEAPDAGIPGWQSNDPDEGSEEPEPPTTVCTQIARVSSYYRDLGAKTRPMSLQDVDVFELCSGETHNGCTLLQNGELEVPSLWGGPTTSIDSGCWGTDRYDAIDVYIDGCCFVDALTEFATPSCSDDVRDGMHCAPEDQCMLGRCAGGVCEPDAPISCDDDNFCNGPEWCDSGTGCRRAFSPAFDSDPCTTDSCDEATDVVTHAPLPTPAESDAGGALSGEGLAQCSDLCSGLTEVYVAQAEEEFEQTAVSPEVSAVEVGCGDVVEHCQRAENGEWYVASELGDPLTLPVSEGCAVYAWTEEAVLVGTLRTRHHVQKCCVGVAPFVDGERVGDSVIALP